VPLSLADDTCEKVDIVFWNADVTFGSAMDPFTIAVPKDIPSAWIVSAVLGSSGGGYINTIITPANIAVLYTANMMNLCSTYELGMFFEETTK